MLKCLMNGYTKVGGPLINHQSVRWARTRKPFWLGKAKSKMFVIPKPKRKFTPEETVELRRLREEYEQQLNSIVTFIKNTNPLHLQENERANEDNINKQLQNDMEESFKRNELWNAKSAEFRETRIHQTLTEYSEEAKTVLRAAEERKEREKERIEEIVRQEKIKRESFITPENLDEAIEKCLNNLVEYNFGIDFNGNRIEGKEPYRKADKVEIVQSEEMEQSAGG